MYTQNPVKINVRFGIFLTIIGPFLIAGNDNEETYLELRQDVVDSAITNPIGNNNKHQQHNEDQIIFQHEGTSPHYPVVVSEYLYQTYPGLKCAIDCLLDLQ